MAQSQVLSVSDLTFAIKSRLEGGFPSIAVQGEITNCKLHSAGHLYFDLKDAQAKIPAVMFRSSVSSLERMPKEGDQVILNGALSVYPPHGKYQLIARSMTFAGLGQLLLQLEALKKKLSERGWFDNQHKKPLPHFPRRIGVVTSPTGAVIRDIINVLTRRYPGFQLLLNPVRVQGDGAAGEIASAIEYFNQHDLADVLIVGRGGGSLEDLWAFNEEIVAKAIFESRIPIVSAVGHETDFTIADCVADVRAPTPSAAAELISQEKAQVLTTLAKSRSALTSTLTHLLRRTRDKLEAFARHPLLASPYALLGNALQRLDELRTQIDHSTQHQLKQKRLLLQGSRAALVALDPKKVLQRGYSILFAQKSGSVIVSAAELAPGTEVRALLSDGEAELVVKGD